MPIDTWIAGLFRQLPSRWIRPRPSVRRARYLSGAASIEQLERRQLLTDVSGPITSNTVWSITSEPYVVVDDVTVNTGVTLTIMPGVTVLSNHGWYDIFVDGTLDATGVTFAGTDTDIDVRSGGRLNLKSGSSVSGDEVWYANGSLGMVTNSEFGSAKLRLETTAVIVNDNKFSSTDPVLANPSVIPSLYDNQFLNPATIHVYGVTTDVSSIWHPIPNVSTYRLDEDVTVSTGKTLTIQSGVTVLSNHGWYDIFVDGTLDATGVTFAGTDTDIDVRSGGRLNLKNGSSVTGDKVTYQSGSLGDINLTDFYSDLVINSVGSHQIKDNSFLAKTVRARGNAADVIDLRNNYWGTTNSAQIASQIEDRNDNAALPLILFSPFHLSHPDFPPTDIALSVATVAENQPSDTTIGVFSTQDATPGDTFSYTLVAGAGSTNNSSFTISGNTLKTAAIFDFETKNSYKIRARVTDAGGLTIDKQFTISVTNTNDAPTGFSLSASSVPENLPVGTSIGEFSPTDPDAGDTFAYVLVSGTGSIDNGSFTVSGNTLKTASGFNFETKNSYTIRVKVTDAGGFALEQQFTINVTNANEAPTSLNLSNSSLPENQLTGTVVGTFDTIDPDAIDSFTYSLVAGTGSTDNSKFTINGNSLKTAASFDFETKSSYSIRVKVTDAGGLASEQQFTITVTNVDPNITITGPAVATPSQRPAFTWTEVSGATSYEIWLKKDSDISPYPTITVTQASYTPPADLGIGGFKVAVRSISNSFIGEFTPNYSFVINTPAVMRAIAKSQPTLRPTINWDLLPGAVKYDVWINDLSRGITQYIRDNNVTTGNSFTPSSDMPMGLYRAWVRGIAADGTFGNWSGAIDFQTMPAPTITAPLNSTFSRRPVFTWNPVSGATAYELQIKNTKTGALTYNPTGLTGTNWTPPSNLPDGPYRWWAIAIGPNNLRGFWTAPVDINIGGGTAVLTPTGTTSNQRPTFTWKTVDGAARYELWVTNVGLNTRPIFETNLLTTSYTPVSLLAKGTYRAWVRAVSISGEVGAWSSQADFVIARAKSVESESMDQFALASLGVPMVGARRLLSAIGPASAGAQNEIQNEGVMQHSVARYGNSGADRVADRTQETAPEIPPYCSVGLRAFIPNRFLPSDVSIPSEHSGDSLHDALMEEFSHTGFTI